MRRREKFAKHKQAFSSSPSTFHTATFCFLLPNLRKKQSILSHTLLWTFELISLQLPSKTRSKPPKNPLLSLNSLPQFPILIPLRSLHSLSIWSPNFTSIYRNVQLWRLRGDSDPRYRQVLQPAGSSEAPAAAIATATVAETAPEAIEIGGPSRLARGRDPDRLGWVDIVKTQLCLLVFSKEKC